MLWAGLGGAEGQARTGADGGGRARLGGQVLPLLQIGVVMCRDGSKLHGFTIIMNFSAYWFLMIPRE